MRYEGEIDGTAIFSYLLNPSLESVVGQVVSGCVGFDSVLLLTKKIDQNLSSDTVIDPQNDIKTDPPA